jgi:CubicO group peptidase (beta-lactamase class C family)
VNDHFKLARIQNLLTHAAESKIGSGSAAAWGKISELSDIGFTHAEVFAGTTSHLFPQSPVGAETFFDFASLTKILATTSLFMIFSERGWCDLDQPLHELDSELVRQYPHLADITLKHLLTHTSGMEAHRNFFEKLHAHYGHRLPTISVVERNEKMIDLALSVPLEREPGEKAVYSDLGFMCLAHLAERIFARFLPVGPAPDFNELVQKLVWSKFKNTLHFRPVVRSALGEVAHLEFTAEEIAATELCPWRGLLVGQVQDDNCWSAGGVGGHAGVFGTLNDARAWTQALMNGQFATRTTLRKFLTEQPGIRRTLGFDMPSVDGLGSTGFSFGANTVGHLGYTGTSLWIDLDRGVYAILLTNRVHPSREDIRIRALRQRFHEEVMK